MSTDVFPTVPGVTYPVKRKAEWSTRVQTAISGKETRVALWSYPRWTWEIPIEFLRATTTPELQSLIDFYNSHKGQYESWLYSDPTDCMAAGQIIGVGDGATTTFQLVRSFSGPGGFVEPVYAPRAIGTVYVAGAALSPSAWSAQGWGATSPGQLTLIAAPASGAQKRTNGHHLVGHRRFLSVWFCVVVTKPYRKSAVTTHCRGRARQERLRPLRGLHRSCRPDAVTPLRGARPSRHGAGRRWRFVDRYHPNEKALFSKTMLQSII